MAAHVAVVGLHQAELTEADQEALAEELVGAIDAQEHLRGLLPRHVAGTIVGREQPILDDGLVGTARQQLAAGIDLYNQAQFDASIGLLEEAIVGLELGFPGHLDVADLWKAHAYLGNARAQAGRDGMEQALEAAAVLAPYLPLDEALFPPHVVEAHRAAVDRLLAAPVTLTVEADGPGEAYVDGLLLGPVPAVADKLPAGVHHVVVRGAGGRVGYRRVDLTPEPLPSLSSPEEEEGEGADKVLAPPEPQPPRAERVDVTMGPPSLAQAAPRSMQRSDQIGDLYRALGTRAAGVDLVLLGGVHDDALQLQLYHPPTDGWSRPIEVPYQGNVADEAVASLGLLLNVVQDDGTLGALDDEAVPLDISTNTALASLLLAPPAPLPFPGSDEGKGKGNTALVVGIVAGVVAVAAIGGVAAYAAGRSGSDPTTTGTTTTTPTTPDPVNNGSIVLAF